MNQYIIISANANRSDILKEVVKMSEVTILFSDDDKKNLEKYMETTHGGKWNIHDDFDIMDIMQVVLNDIDKKVNSK